MKLVSWNCKKGLNSKDKYKKLSELCPDMAVIQESFHPKEYKDHLNYHDSIWAGENKDKGLGVCVLSFSKDYQLTMLVEEVQYEWIVPIKVTGKESFTLLAVWTKRMTGSSYGKVLYSALQEYERYIVNGPVIIIGDFNLDKRVPSSYSGIGGYKKIIDLFNSFGLKSCYHLLNNEEFGSESHATYYHYGKLDRPFHLDYCLVSHGVLRAIQQFYIGRDMEYAPLSDHLPLVVEFSLSSDMKMEDSIQEDHRIEEHLLREITPEILKQEYRLIIDKEFVTDEEMDEAVRFIKALRKKKNQNS